MLGWICWCGSVLLGVLAIIVVIRTVIGDRARGRRRCPKCWYELGEARCDVPLRRCSECGYDPRSERELLGSRRRWGWLVVAGVLGLAADSVRRIPDPDSEGWTRFVPTTVMILVPPMSREEWVGVHFDRARPTGALAGAFEKRLKDRTLAVWQERLWGWRLGSSDGPFEDGVCDGLRCATIEAKPLLDVLWGTMPQMTTESRDCSLSPPEIYVTRTYKYERDRAADIVEELVRWFVEPDSWIDNGGSEGRISWFEGRVFVVHRPAVIDQIGRLVAVLGSEVSSPDRVTDPASLERDRSILRRLAERRARFAGERLTVAEIVDRVNQDAPAGEWVRTGDVLGGLLATRRMTMPLGSVSVINVINRIEADCFYGYRRGQWGIEDGGVLLDQETGAEGSPVCMQVYDVADVLDRHAQLQLLDHSCASTVEERMSDLIDVIQSIIEPERWFDNGGAEYQCAVLRERLVVVASRRHQVEVADLLARIRALPAVPSVERPRLGEGEPNDVLVETGYAR